MMRALLAAGTAALALAAAPRLAAAQHCHVDVPDGKHGDADHGEHAGHHGHDMPAPRRWWLGGSSTAVVGSGTVLGRSRDYQGVSLALSGGWSRFSGKLALPAYRVADEGVGLGEIGRAHV